MCSFIFIACFYNGKSYCTDHIALIMMLNHGVVYSIQHYVIKFVNDLRQVGGFPWVLRFPPPIKLTDTI